MSPISGSAHTFGDNIDTDVIIPARYLTTTDPAELGAHCMEALDPDFPTKVSSGDILVGGRNFGSGSSREHAPLALMGAGIGAVIASSFARIFFRNALNLGLPIVECPEIVSVTEPGDRIEIDLQAGLVTNITKGAEARSIALPPSMQELLDAGGLIPHLRRRLGIVGEAPVGSSSPAPKEADLLHD